MSQQDQHDWPSFETVLRDLAPDSPTARSLASADRRADYAKSAAEIRAEKSTPAPAPASPVAEPKTDDAEASTDHTPDPPEQDVTEQDVTEQDVTEQDDVDLRSVEPTRLPAPLPPLELDTSSIRALLGYEPSPMPDASHPALDALQPSPELPVPELDSPYLDEDFALSLFDDERVADRRVNNERRVHDGGITDSPEFDDETVADRRVAEVRRENDDRRVNDGSVEDRTLDSDSLDTDSVDSVDDARQVDVEAPVEIEPVVAEIEIEAEPEIEVEPLVADTEPEPEIQIDDVAPTFDAATDGVAFDVDSTFDSDVDNSLVFELDDASLSEIDAAATQVETTSELDDPFFDAPVPDTDTDLFSTSDVPELTSNSIESNSMDLDAGLPDDPFSRVSVDLSPDTFDPHEIETIEDTSPLDAVAEEDDLNGDSEPEDIPDIVALSYGEGATTIELPEQSFEPELFDDLAPLAEGDAINLSDLTTDLADLSTDLGDSPDSNDHRFIDERNADLFDLTFEPNDLAGPTDANEPVQLPSTTFDSVAAAEEIEDHLDSLLSFEDPESEEALARVIPLRPDGDPVEPVGFDEEPIDDQWQEEPAEPEQEAPKKGRTGWVSLPPEVESKAPDPWAHMRPVEEPKKKGFWANRPKFFGGSERRNARAKREEAVDEEIFTDADVGISYDKGCPNCGDECKVDLDDPIGRRVHVSCPSCKHMWHTPYILEETG